MIKLPPKFLREMQELWDSHRVPGELEEFLASFQEEASAGMLLNRLKLHSLADLPEEDWASYLFPSKNKVDKSKVQGRREEADKDAPESLMDLEAVPWAEAGYFLPPKHKLSASLSYRQGLFYLQDPSAMLPADLAAAQTGEWVLDLCAAPGGKAFAVLASLGNQGLLLANEINEKRARALSRNVELAGSSLCLLSCRDAVAFSEQFKGDRPYFDLVLADVPCTGSAMFRKDPTAIHSWSRYRGQAILDLQAAILDEAAHNLRPGGRLVYSTCSYSWDENEGQIINFLDRHPDFTLLPVKRPGTSPALADPLARYPTENALRIWPHLARGEGQFAALLVKEGPNDREPKVSRGSVAKGPARAWKSALESWHEFYRANLSGSGRLAKTLASPDFDLRVQEGKVHLLPAQAPLSPQTYYLKTGLYLGQAKGEAGSRDFQPSQALAQFMDLSDLSWAIELEDGGLLRAALRGETLLKDQVKSALSGHTACLFHRGTCVRVEALADLPAGAYLALAYQGRPLLWLKAQDHFFKNAYPRSWI